jgi:PIN domain nuclease of toxin-antitoxin system
VRLLLDTHAFLWLLKNDERLGRTARGAIFDPANNVFVSIVSLWELAVKIRVGKLRIMDMEDVFRALLVYKLDLLPLEFSHLSQMLRLPKFPDHRDPFDQQLIAQALAENLTFVSEDRNVPRYAVPLLACSA